MSVLVTEKAAENMRRILVERYGDDTNLAQELSEGVQCSPGWAREILRGNIIISDRLQANICQALNTNRFAIWGEHPPAYRSRHVEHRPQTIEVLQLDSCSMPVMVYRRKVSLLRRVRMAVALWWSACVFGPSNSKKESKNNEIHG